MQEMTLEGLLRLGNSWYVENVAKFMVIWVEVEGNAPEMIVNPRENFNTKLHCYKGAYNDDLTLKANPKIKIIRYDFIEELSELFGIE